MITKMDLLYHHGETLHHSVQNINIFHFLDIYYTHTVVKVGFTIRGGGALMYMVSAEQSGG